MTERPPAPLPATACPLCGGPSGCAPAVSGSFDSPCWCTTVRIPAEVLVRIPAAQRGLACVCRQCALGSTEAAQAAVSAKG